ncbi:MAG: signal recognition particle protein Srp54 [Desulfurococcaceae archaeon]|uniref:Signal recognition particle 54 kDa protein n=1 Tax=Staphylothermus marinus TaxID=2280 RepID=A0A7C4D6K4_STAMA
MVLDGLRNALAKFLKSSRYEEAVEDFIKDLQKELIKSDVNINVVVEISKRIRDRALKEEPPIGVSRKDWFITIVYEELTNLFGGSEKPNIKPSKKPWIMLLIGLQGSGKTTTAAKIAFYYKTEGYRVGLVSADTYRPAAYEQLKQLGDQIGVPVYGEPSGGNAVEIARRGVEYFVNNRFDIVIIDTAGRHHREETLLEEMREISRVVNPDEIVLVIDASLGQQAFNIAKKFHSTTPIGSIVVTKLDGTAKGGGALSAVVATNARIKFIGTGEKLDELEVFNPSRFIARILGIGDIESLVERVKRIQVEFTEKDIEDLMSGRINMRLIYKQLINIRKLGPFKKILQLIPGLGLKIPFEVDPRELEEKVSKWISAINSMTYEELDNPDIIDKNRVKRIAIGSGVDQENVRELIKQYNMLKKITRELKKRKDILRKLREMGFQTDSIE